MHEINLHHCGRTLISDHWHINPSVISNKLYYINSGHFYCDDLKLTEGNFYIISDSSKHDWRIGSPFDHLHFDFSIFPKLLFDDIVTIPLKSHKHLPAFLDACNTLFSDKTRVNSRELNTSILLSLLHLLNEVVPIFKAQDNLISKVISIIKHSEKMPTVNDLAKLCNLEVSYFIKKFKKESGMTPYQFINNFRLENAYTDLNKNLSVSEVALKYGFSSESSFSNAFMKRFGIRPSYIKK